MPYGKEVTTTYSAPALAALVTVAVPDADPVEVTGPHPSADALLTARVSEATGRSWMVWAPTSKAASISIETQVDVLRALAREHRAGRLRPAVPAPRGLVPIPGGRRALVTSAPEGRRLREDDLREAGMLADELGTALASLHSVDPAVVRQTGMPDYSVAECRTRLHALIDEAAGSAAIPAVLFDRWERFLSTDDLWRFTPRVVHGSLGAESCWWDGRNVSMISDLSRIHVGDPADDLAWVFSVASDPFLERFMRSYTDTRHMSSPHALTERASFMGEIALVKWLVHGMHSNDSEVIDDARGLLAELADAVRGEEASLERDAADRAQALAADHTLTERVDMGEVFNRD